MFSSYAFRDLSYDILLAGIAIHFKTIVHYGHYVHYVHFMPHCPLSNNRQQSVLAHKEALREQKIPTFLHL